MGLARSHLRACVSADIHAFSLKRHGLTIKYRTRQDVVGVPTVLCRPGLDPDALASTRSFWHLGDHRLDETAVNDQR